MKHRIRVRNHAAKALRTPVFRMRVVRNVKTYTRKGRAVQKKHDRDAE